MNLTKRFHEVNLRNLCQLYEFSAGHYLLLNKKAKSKDTSKRLIERLISFVDIITLDKKIIVNALNSKFDDFEDAVIEFSAKSVDINIIVTRNEKVFIDSEVQILNPNQFISKYLK